MPKKTKKNKQNFSTSSVLWLLDPAWKKIRILDKHPGSARLLYDNLSVPDSGFFGQKCGKI
jgi:hypothetical protein